MEKIKRLLKAIKRIIKGEDDELLEQLSDFPNSKDIVNLESEYEKKIAKLLRKERSFFIGQISADVSEKTTLDDISTHLKKEVFASDEFDKEMEKVNKTFLGQAVKHFSKTIMGDIDKDVPFVGVSKDANDRIKNWSKELATHVKEYTHQAIERELLLEKATKGSPEAFLRVLRNLPEFDRSRARTIAVTETMTAQGIAEWEAYRQSPAVNGKTWQHSLSGGGMSRPAHVSLSGTTIGTNEEFQVNGYQAQFPRDPSLPASERVRCRCRLVPSIDQSVLKLPKVEKEKMLRQVIQELKVKVPKDNNQAVVRVIDGVKKIIPIGYTSLEECLNKVESVKGYASKEEFKKTIENVEKYLNDPTNNRPSIKNQSRAGTVYKDVEFDIIGFPIFDKYSKYELQLEAKNFKLDRDDHFKICTQKLKESIERGEIDKSNFTSEQLSDIEKGASKISGLTWHHHQIEGKMQLVDEDYHDEAKHTGGNAIWGKGN
ncbi:HNH endonuclease [Brevibacillus sp. SYSU BS000544]|uniref:HNH endonuclease n=1 Tax=Brevibacillus sp. SYSU BS000544 TaxID=3416443 RepID=UPI003CE512A0